MTDLTPRYTPEVKRAADQIRKIVSGLTLTEILALKESLEQNFPIDPFEGVREPWEPKPKAGSPGAAVKPEEI